MRADQTISEPSLEGAPPHASLLEVALARLADVPPGSGRRAVIHHFCQTFIKETNAAGVCVCEFTERDGWRVTLGEGELPWAAIGNALRPAEIDLMERALTEQKCMAAAPFTEPDAKSSPGQARHLCLAAPFISSEGSLGAALLQWNSQTPLANEDGLRTIAVIAKLFAARAAAASVLERVEVSRKQWVQMIDAIRDMIVVHDRSGKILRTNELLASRLEMHPVQLLGRGVGDVLGASAGESGEGCPLCLVSASGIGGPIELFGQNGFLVSTTQMSVQGSEETQTIHVLVDIRARLEAERALQRERDFNKSIVDNTNSVIFVLNAEGGIRFANPRADDLGYARDKIVGLAVNLLIHEKHRSNFDEIIARLRTEGTAQFLEAPVIRRDGNVARFAIHLTAMRPEDGEEARIVVVMTDITEASVLQAKLAHTEKMAALGRLVSGVAHEINNPLAAIVGFSDLLLENPQVPFSAREQLSAILKEAERTRVLVRDLLRFAREMPAHCEPVNVNSVLRETVMLCSVGPAKKRAAVALRLAENVPAVPADSNHLKQVFLNILNNAFDAVEETGRPGCIEIDTELCGASVEIRIRDNGSGISNADRIFEPFFSTKPVGKGTGLGLSICYGIVRAHNGEILCQNNSGAPGCTFIVRLPAAPRSPSSYEVSDDAGITHSSSRR